MFGICLAKTVDSAQQALGRLACTVLLGAASLFALWCLAGAATPARAETADQPERAIYAHYMGNYPVAARATSYHRRLIAHLVRHDWETYPELSDGSYRERLHHKQGGRWRNWDFVPFGHSLSPVEAADLDIRRGMRAGLDGFALDAWSGSEGAREMLHALFEVAEREDYDFYITICLDPNTGGGNSPETAAETIRYLLEHHGDSPKLARRDGKPLIFGYQSLWTGVHRYLEDRDDLEHIEADRRYQDPSVRLEPEAWERIGLAYQEVQELVGEPLFIHFCLSAFFHNVPRPDNWQDVLVEAAATIAKHVDAVGEFTNGGEHYDRMAPLVQEAGAEWSEPMWAQYDNYWTHVVHASNGTERLRDRWERARENNSTIIQYITWNDYTEATNLAPCYNQRYAMMSFNKYLIDWWRNGEPPEVDEDRIYLFYHKYPEGADTFPFDHVHQTPGVLEVVTILTDRGRINLPGRSETYGAPAGLHIRHFPLKPGDVIAELYRDGQRLIRLESPEPITERPFREDHGLVGFSTVCEREWEKDFPGQPFETFSEYGDMDGDGLPNWFEMYWFGKFLDWSTATIANPREDFNNDGKTNLQHYRDQTNPTEGLPRRELEILSE